MKNAKKLPSRAPSGRTLKPPSRNKKPDDLTAPVSESSTLKDRFVKKIKVIMKPLNFTDETKDVEQKNARLKAIQDLQLMLQNSKHMQSIIMPNLEVVMRMIERNIFRPLPCVIKKANLGFSETGLQQEDEADPSWPHLQVIYEFTLQLMFHECCDVKLLKPFITPRFVQDFLGLFDSQEPSEREYLKTILHKIYAKVVPRRKMIRKAMNDLFYTLIHQNTKFNGVSELLDILASIISGFAVPLREEHIIFFKNIIIPLHKVFSSSLYYEQLLRCSMLFLHKDKTLTNPVSVRAHKQLIEGLLRYWPFANCFKQSLFLAELQEVLETADTEAIGKNVEKIFRRLMKCIGGMNLQISDRAMCLFESDHFLEIVKNHKNVVLPILAPQVQELAQNHWHIILKESLNALRTIIREVDPELYQQLIKQHCQKKRKENMNKTLNAQKWKILEAKVKAAHPKYQAPRIPFNVIQTPGSFNDVYSNISNKDQLMGK